MDLTSLRASIDANKVPLGLGGAVVVALLAWRAKVAGKTPAAAVSGTAAATSTPGVASSPYASSGYTAPNDSTGSDVYNALEPELESLKAIMTPVVAPIPVPAAPVVPETADQLREDQISQWYQTSLMRAGTPAELAYWDGTVTGGLRNMSNVHAAIMASPEAQGNR
jgi:hypothetical protein